MRRRRVASKRYGGLEVRCRRVASICLKSPGTLEAHCRRRDVEVFASRDRELGRRAAGVQTWMRRGMERWRSGGDVGTCRRHRGMVRWRSGGGVGMCRSLPQEQGRRAASVLPLCLKSSGDALQALEN